MVYLWAEKLLSRPVSLKALYDLKERINPSSSGIVIVSLLPIARLIRCISALILDGVGQNSELLSEVHSLEIELECKFRVIKFLS